MCSVVCVRLMWVWIHVCGVCVVWWCMCVWCVSASLPVCSPECPRDAAHRYKTDQRQPPATASKEGGKIPTPRIAKTAAKAARGAGSVRGRTSSSREVVTRNLRALGRLLRDDVTGYPNIMIGALTDCSLLLG